MKPFSVKLLGWVTSTFTRTYRAHHLYALPTLELTGNCMSSSDVALLGRAGVSTLFDAILPSTMNTRDLGGGKNRPWARNGVLDRRLHFPLPHLLQGPKSDFMLANFTTRGLVEA